MKTLIYDLPTRIFHWSFAALFIAAFAITKLVKGDSPQFPLHMLAGLTLGVAVLLRVIWGLIGTRHARFADFDLKPSSLLAYFKGILARSKARWC